MKKIIRVLLAAQVAAFVFLAGCESSDDDDSSNDAAEDVAAAQAAPQSKDDGAPEVPDTGLKLEDIYGSWDGTKRIVYEGTNYVVSFNDFSFSEVFGIRMWMWVTDEVSGKRMGNQTLWGLNWNDETKSLSGVVDAGPGTYLISFSSPTTAVMAIEGMYGGFSMDITKWSWEIEAPREPYYLFPP